MSSVVVEGGKPLAGTIRVSGAKNSVLKLIPAAMFSNEDIVIENVPRMYNVQTDLEVIESIGGKYEWTGKNRLLLNGSKINSFEIPYELGSKYRTASLLSAPLIYRFGKASIPKPGGCKIGFRPINRWISTWEKLGIRVIEDDKFVHLDGTQRKGDTEILFKTNTHMGTDNAILSSLSVSGEVVINNAAAEPEVDDLISFVNLMGAKVERTDDRRIKIIGANQFEGGFSPFTVMEDRNEVVTFIVGALVTGGNIIIKGANQTNLLAFVNVISKMGCKYEFSREELRVWRGNESLSPVNVTTAPHPGFMTDWQPLIALLVTLAEGESLVHDTIYTDRFGYVVDLNRMGAKITLHKPSELGLKPVVSDDSYDVEKMGEPKTVAKIVGPSKLRGEKMNIPDLRAGATLILAALAADGKSELNGYENVSRGYEDFLSKISDLGGSIYEQP